MLSPAPLFARMTALAEPVRSRMLVLLDKRELTVSELMSVLQLPQSTVSRHLKLLGDEGWLVSRAEGTSRRYRVQDALDSPSRRLWQIVREQVAATPAATNDARRLKSVLARRRGRSQKFFSSAASRWDRLRAELFGNRADLLGALALLDEDWVVGDLGCGTGQLSEALSPFVTRVIAVDDSMAMLGAARKRLDSLDNVEVRGGRLEALPLDDGSLDAALLFLVLHYVPEPDVAVAEASRALRPGGRLVVVDMMPHEREDLRQDMGHVWPGFSEPALRSIFRGSGLERLRYIALPPDEAAKGPTLFAATARKPEVSRASADATGDTGSSALVLSA